MPDLRNEVTFDSENGLGHIHMLIPLKDVKQMTLEWPMLPESRIHYQTKPVSYLTHVLGHEGPNSLLSTLISEGLVSSLSAGMHERLNAQKSGMKITYGLTSKGVTNWEQILKITFAFINKIRAEKPQKYIFEEEKIMREINFINATQGNALNIS